MSEKRYQDEQWLQEQYVGHKRTVYDIADECGCSGNTILNWLQKHDIETQPRQPVRYERLADSDWLREQYIDQGRSSIDIADECGCSDSTVRRWLERHDIETRSSSYIRYEQLTDPDWLRKQYIGRERTISDIADGCGCGNTTVRRWLERHDIEIRSVPPTPDKRLEDSDWLREQYIERALTIFDIADECRCSYSTVRDWLERHDIERRDAGLSGEDHPQWAGGRMPYGPGWNDSKKRHVRERDGYECIGCGTTQSEHLDEYGQNLHVHHLLKARDVDDPEERNAMENLVTLCRDCHRKWERISEARIRPQVIHAIGSDD